MMTRCLAVLGCFAVLVTLAHSAAVPTQDTLVVAKSDDTITSSTPVPVVAEVTTEDGALPIKLTEMEVTSEVSLRYAHTTVVARVRNPAKRAQEAHFRVLLPETAFISGFVMTLDGKSYKAYVKEKEEAKQIYQDAVMQGIGAAHISAKARDSNHFTASVNVEANSVAVFNLTYEELLTLRNGVYNHAINLHCGALVPKLTVTVHIKESAKITELRVPEIRTGNEIDATKDDAQNSKATIVRGHDDREATITFTPDLKEQERLIQIYAEKAKESAASTHSYSPWGYEPEPEPTPEGVLGQFVVQYNVDRPKDGEVLVNDGYFVHFFAPQDLKPLNKFVVFVLDTSGSMMDRKIVQLREAMQTILSELNAGDYFSIVEFASSVTVHDLKEADGEPPKNRYSYFDYDKEATLVPPSPVTPENIAKAKVIVSWLQANGGTNIGKALDIAVELINKGVDWKVPANVTQSSPKQPTTTTEAATTEGGITTAPIEVTTENANEKTEPKLLESIIIFLTDGDPTVGETDPKRILTRLQEKNSGPNKAPVYALAFGEDADRKFLRKVALRFGGFMRHIYEAADAALQLRDFYRQISSPLIANLKFSYPPGQVKADSLTKHDFRTYFKGSEVVVAGRVENGATELAPQVEGFCGVDDGYGRKKYEIFPKVPVEQKKTGYLPLERLWSYLTIKQLLDQQEADDKPTEDKENTPEKKALALALKYEFVTPLTSLVVVKPNATSAVNAESVDKPAGPPVLSGIALSADQLSRPVGGSGWPAAQYSGAQAFSSAAFQPDTLQYEAFAESEIDDYTDVDLRSSLHSSSGFPYRTFGPQRGSSPSGNVLSLSHSGHSAFGSSVATHHSYPVSGGLRGSSFHSYPSSSSFSGSLHNHRYPSPSPVRFDTSQLRPSKASSTHDSVNRRRSKVKSSNSYIDLAQHSFVSTPASPVPTYRPSASDLSTTTAKPSLLEFYLQNYSWAEPLLKDDTLVLPTNTTEVALKLVKEPTAPKETTGDAACDNAVVEGGAGLCVYLTRCDAAKDITVEIYKNTYCSINSSYAGVCCPKTKVDLSH